MFIGAYWSQRKETKEAAANRISTFLLAIAEHSEEFKTWFSKGRSRRDALRTQIPTDPTSIQRKLRVRRRDDNREIMVDLGFGFSAWNGKNASFSADVGIWCQWVGNSAVLSVNSGEPLSNEDLLRKGLYRTLLEEMIRAFDPEHAVVRSNEHMAQHKTTNVWEAGWFTYSRDKGDGIQEHPFP